MDEGVSIRRMGAGDAAAVAVAPDLLAVTGQIVDLPHPTAGRPGPHMRFAGLVRALPKGGSVTGAGSSLYVDGADEVVLRFRRVP